MSAQISAIILAAGESRRMGQPKLLLPWGKTTVLGQVITTFTAAGIQDIVVVTGGAREQVEALAAELKKKYPVRTVYNPAYANGGMLSSIQTGLRDLTLPPPSLRDTSPKSEGFGGGRVGAALITLGDQPQVRAETIRHICAAFIQTESPLVIPSFENRRGHPWLASHSLWPEILALPASTTPREFLNNYAGQIAYVEADESILQDLDTPEEYNRQRP